MHKIVIWSKEKINHLKIRHKILLFYFILIVLSIGLSVAIYQRTSVYYMSQKMKEVAIQGIRSDSRSLEMLIDDINNYSKILLANQTVQKTLQVDEGNIKNRF